MVSILVKYNYEDEYARKEKYDEKLLLSVDEYNNNKCMVFNVCTSMRCVSTEYS